MRRFLVLAIVFLCLLCAPSSWATTSYSGGGVPSCTAEQLAASSTDCVVTAAQANTLTGGTDWTTDQGATNIHINNIPSLSSLYLPLGGGTLTGGLAVEHADGLKLGKASTTIGTLYLYGNAKAFPFGLWSAGADAPGIGWKLPSVMAGGDNYLVHVSADGTMGYTDPASLFASPGAIGTTTPATALTVGITNTVTTKTQLDAALAAATPGTIIDLAGNTFAYTTTRIDITANNITIRNGTLDFSGLTATDGTYKTGIKVLGTGRSATNNSAFTADSVIGAYTIGVADGSQFTAGDWVQCVAEDVYPYDGGTTNVKRGEIKQVLSVATNTVTFRQPFYEVYTTANTATLYKIGLVEKFTLENVNLIGTNTAGGNNVGVRLYWTNHARIANCNFSYFDLESISVWNSLNTTVEGGNEEGVRYTGTGSNFYGIALYNNTQGFRVSGVNGQQLRHLVVTSASQTEYGQPFFGLVNHCRMTNAQAGGAYDSWAYENHGFGRWITWDNLQSDGANGGIMIRRGDQVVSNCVFRNWSHNGIQFGNATTGLDLSNITVSNCDITQNTTDYASGQYGIHFTSNANSVRRNIRLINNRINGLVGNAGENLMGIRVGPGSGDAIDCSISGGSIMTDSAYDSAYYGTYVEQKGWKVEGVDFYGWSRPVSLLATAEVLRNTFRLASVPEGDENPSIQCGTGSDYSTIKGNVTRTAYRFASIASGVTGVKISNNDAFGLTATDAVSDSGTGTILNGNAWGTDAPSFSSIVIGATGPVTLTSDGAGGLVADWSVNGHNVTANSGSTAVNLQDGGLMAPAAWYSVDCSTSGSLTAAQVSGTHLTNYGQGAADITMDLPTAAAGMNFIADMGTAQGANKWRVRAGANDKIYVVLNAAVTAGSDNGYFTRTNPAVGDSCMCYTFQTGATAWDWKCQALVGTWAAETP